MAAPFDLPLLFPLFLATSLCSLALSGVSAQPGFISLDCGGQYTDTRNDSNGLSWNSDQTSINLGSTAYMQNAPKTLAFPLTTIRYFPAAGNVKKFCYMLQNLTKGKNYLVRATFAYGNYSGKLKQLPIRFDLVLDANNWATVNLTEPEPAASFEVYAQARSDAISVCLARSTNDDPFISTLELRPLSLQPMRWESFISPNQQYLRLSHRVNYGAGSTASIRYPNDSFDRIWVADSTPAIIATTNPVQANLKDKPPSEVLMTAIGAPGPRENLSLTFNTFAGSSYFFALYFSEIDGNVSREGERVFEIYLNEKKIYGPFDVFKTANNTHNIGEELPSALIESEGSMNFTLIPAETSKLGPLLNAIEILQISNLVECTHQDDINALTDVKKSLNLSQWSGDPCLPLKYDWLECSSTSPPRVVSLMLSHRNCSGSLSPSINSLTELTQISLDNNQLVGSIPNLSLVKLQKLDLQNNTLSGPIPESLALLPSLIELFLQNNDLTGAIPPDLLQKKANPLLEFIYDGNPNLYLSSVERCSSKVPSVSSSAGRENKFLIALVVICAGNGLAGIGIAFYCVNKRKKLKATRAEIESPIHDCWEEKGQTPTDAPIIMNRFTYNQIQVATRYFTTKIGQGAFGPVFHGVLENGYHVAVKVLSGDSRQGLREFSNEVFHLSRVHHRNVVSIVGYCNDPEYMLVYEYMAKGTLRDHLYGPLSSRTSLSWRKRLEIAVDAALGLEYLHSSCEPTIIHRDVKSSNILLNEKMKAKIGDFGLSKLKREEGLAHISTAIMGTPGYLDPEYCATSQLTDKSDVYSFGIVLLEIICRRPPLDTSLPESQCKIVDWVVEVAMKSTHFKRSKRPSMSEIVFELKEANRIEVENSIPPMNQLDTTSSELISCVSAR